jgi:hypothetical protein
MPDFISLETKIVAVRKTIRGEDAKQVAADLGVTATIVEKWCDYFASGGESALRRRASDDKEDLRLFISHKHSDARIAGVIADWIRQKSNGRVLVHLSSNPEFEGPRTGLNLNEQLIEELWKTDAFILVYTSGGDDWSYCMWECGIATDSSSPDTSIRVLQCGAEVPPPFAEKVRIKASRRDDIKRFTIEFLRQPNFFPGRPSLAPNLKDSDIDEFARDLHDKLTVVLPAEPALEWAVWPYIRIELPLEELEQIKEAEESERKTRTIKLARELGIVADSSPDAFRLLFNTANLGKRYPIKDLIRHWKEMHPNLEPGWFVSCCEQIVNGWLRRFPLIRPESVQQEGGDEAFVPVLSRVMQIPSDRIANFDFYFYDLSDPRATPATTRMIHKDHVSSIRIGKTRPEEINLRWLIRDLKNKGINRLPILNDDDWPLYVIHRSMFERFFSDRYLSGDESSPETLTLADLLGDELMKRFVESTFVIVSQAATLEEAKKKMNSVPDCRDVFVTPTGGKDEPIIGWLTNVRMSRS